jgi:RsiW-degrading membrane proteinase PrsW (M82 family)
VLGWWVAVAAGLAGGVFAIFGAFMESQPWGLAVGGLIVAVVFGPAVEETMKIAAAALVVELRPWVFRRAEQVQLATVGSAAVFAAIENVIYLTVYVPQASAAVAAWRWTACVALHVGCTMIASRGLIEVWQRTVTEHRPPRMADGVRMLALAIVIHGLYNAAVIGYETFGLPF